MSLSVASLRIFFIVLSVLCSLAYTLTTEDQASTISSIATAIGSGLVFGVTLVAIDNIFKKFDLRSFNLVIVGLLFGYLLGQGLLLIFDAALNISASSILPQSIPLIRMGLLLLAVYLGVTLTVRASEEIYLSIPFVRFKQTTRNKKDVLVDSSILSDARIIDLAGSGLLDNHMVVPRFIVKELHAVAEGTDEAKKNKASRSLEVLKRLETLPTLELRYTDTDFPDIKDPMIKLIRVARFVDANVITADINRIQQSTIEGVQIINIHSLSNALKPLMQTGESIEIKIQRYGKEPRQGVGYLEDGTMVVVNGGGEYIGDTIQAQVLSVKHTSSGRMIFCNAIEQEERDVFRLPASMTASKGIPSSATTTAGSPHKDYFLV